MAVESGAFFMQALLVAGTTALGSVPIALLGDMSASVMGSSISVAAGMMTGCSVVLTYESLLSSTCVSVFLAVAAGGLLIHFVEWLFAGREDMSFGDLKGANAVAGLVIFFSMFIHSIGEGLSIGISAIHSELDGERNLNLLVLVSMAIHNIPEGMAICMAFCSKGMSPQRAALMAFISNLPQPMTALPSFWLFRRFATDYNLVPIGLGVAAGSMAYVVFRELLPEALEKVSAKRVAACMVPSGLVVLALDACAHFGSSVPGHQHVLTGEL